MNYNCFLSVYILKLVRIELNAAKNEQIWEIFYSEASKEPLFALFSFLSKVRVSWFLSI